MTVLISSVVLLFTLLLGGLIAVMFAGFAKSVQQNEVAVATAEKDKSSRFNPAVTMGFDIGYKEDAATQIKEARLLSAKQAAAQPRGANVNIGRLGSPSFAPLSKSLETDPWTASKIAQYHGWDGTKSGFVRGVAAPVAAGAAAVTIAPPVLIELTDDMAPAEKRTARIANSKAKSAYKKALKAAGIDPKAAVAAPVAGAVAAPVATPAAAAGIEPPTLIEMTEGMDPAEKRAARLANIKAKSAYKKALKAAGIDPKAATAAAPVAVAAAVAPAPAAPAADPVATAGIEPPVLIELTADMDPADKRDARIANSKAKSAYKKALKAAGIDPKSVA